jgi:UrcA family protein
MRNLLLASTLLFATTSPALAREDPRFLDAPGAVEVVPFVPTELASEEGLGALRKRVERAAQRVCNDGSFTILQLQYLYCVAPATKEGLAQLDRVVVRWREGALAGTGSLTIRAR